MSEPIVSPASELVQALRQMVITRGHEIGAEIITIDFADWLCERLTSPGIGAISANDINRWQKVGQSGYDVPQPIANGFYDVVHVEDEEPTVARVEGDWINILGYLKTNQANFARLYRILRGPYEVVSVPKVGDSIWAIEYAGCEFGGLDDGGCYLSEAAAEAAIANMEPQRIARGRYYNMAVELKVIA